MSTACLETSLGARVRAIGELAGRGRLLGAPWLGWGPCTAPRSSTSDRARGRAARAVNSCTRRAHAADKTAAARAGGPAGARQVEPVAPGLPVALGRGM